MSRHGAALAAALLLALAPAAGNARTHRSHAVTRAFERAHPCPSTGKRSGACPGYVKDHVVALCKGGPDRSSNMQWQTVAAGKAKDRWECKP